MRPLRDEHNESKACHDTDPRPTLRNRGHRIDLPAPLDAQTGPQCKLGYARFFNLILWVLYTGMQWKCLPVPQDIKGRPERHDTTVYQVFATWAHDGALWQAFIASVTPLFPEKHLDISILHGDETNTVANKGGMGWGMRGTNTRRAKQ